MNNAVILAAGKSSRLGGENKLLAIAAGKPVHEWHHELLETYETATVTSVQDSVIIAANMPWARIIGYDGFDGPVGALIAYLNSANAEITNLTVIFADTLLREMPQPLLDGDWVAMSAAAGRVWDYWDGAWVRGVPYVKVCVGAYHFTCLNCVRSIGNQLLADKTSPEVSMAQLLEIYDQEHKMEHVMVRDWQDAGDPEALAKVHR